MVEATLQILAITFAGGYTAGYLTRYVIGIAKQALADAANDAKEIMRWDG